MYHTLWLTLDWPWPVFWIAVIVSIAAFFVTRATGALLLSLVLYLGVSWDIWSVVSALFWILWIFGLLCYFMYVVSRVLRARLFAFVFGGLALALVLVLVIGSGLGAMVSGSPDNNASPRDDLTGLLSQPSATVTVTATPTDLGLSEQGAKQVAKDLSKIYKGFKPGQVQAGTGNIPDKTREAATQSFTGKTIKNRQMLSDFFHSDLKLARKAKARVRQALLSKGYDKAEVQRAFANGGHWLWVAPNVASQISGTTYPVKGKIVKENGARGVAPNDAIWFYVTSDGHVLKDASLRADCMNPEVTTVTPIPPGATPPPISKPPGHPQKCKWFPKPSWYTGGTYHWSQKICDWYKPAQTFGQMQNGNAANNGPQNNGGTYTGHTSGATTPPKPQPTRPASTATAPPSDGADGGSTSNPVVTGTPSPDDTATHSTPIPTPTGGAFGG